MECYGFFGAWEMRTDECEKHLIYLLILGCYGLLSQVKLLVGAQLNVAQRGAGAILCTVLLDALMVHGRLQGAYLLHLLIHSPLQFSSLNLQLLNLIVIVSVESELIICVPTSSECLRICSSFCSRAKVACSALSCFSTCACRRRTHFSALPSGDSLPSSSPSSLALITNFLIPWSLNMQINKLTCGCHAKDFLFGVEGQVPECAAASAFQSFLQLFGPRYYAHIPPAGKQFNLIFFLWK